MGVSSYQRKTDTGWKPMLHWPSRLSSDLRESSRQLSPCHNPTLQHSNTPFLHLSILASTSFASNVPYPFLQHLQVLR